MLPSAIWEQISAPQRYAEEAIELNELKLLLMFATPEDTVLRRFDIAEDTADFTIYVPSTDPYFATSLAVVPLQLLAYYVSVAKGLDVDKPRNLAKSVTVE